MTKELVYARNGNLDKQDIITNSFIVAEKAGITHKAVKNQISKREKELKMFGNLTVFTVPSEIGIQYDETGYELNEQQATLLFTFLRNTEQVIEFKVLLVKAFYVMRNELVKRTETRDIAKIDRKNLTDMIVDSGEHERMHNKGIPNYTNLVYKSIFGMNKKQLCENRGFVYEKDMNLREFLSNEEIEKVRQREVMVTEFIKLEYDYGQIKNLLKVK
jgi:phage regulator Rha-like protein